MTVQAQAATVYFGGGCRWLTLKAACRAQARSVVAKHRGEFDQDSYWDWARPRVDRLARMYVRRFKSQFPKDRQEVKP